MAVIAFGAPGIARFHLHERLRRELLQNGHRAVVLCLDRVEHTFFRAQGGEAALIGPSAPDAMRAPLADLAARECQRRGIAPNAPAFARTGGELRDRMARLLPTLVRWFEAERPDLLFLHQRRSSDHGLLQFVALELGVRVLWTGDGLLPHTLQIDDRGLDGDASARRRALADFRVVTGEPSLIDACLTHLLARTTPAALTRREVVAPPVLARGADALAAFSKGRPAEAWRAWSGWREALPSATRSHPLPIALPEPPYATLLLQPHDDERVRLDSDAPITPRAAIAAAAVAVARLGGGTSLVVVAPETGIDERQLRGLRAPVPLHFAGAGDAPEAAATAIATITINHPGAAAALLAGTPVLHFGRALYGIEGATTATTTAGLADALPASLGRSPTTLRRRFLTWLFGHGHVWCSATDPDHNGLAGLVQTIESRLGERSPGGLRLQYRAGPTWPLAAEGRDR